MPEWLRSEPAPAKSSYAGLCAICSFFRIDWVHLPNSGFDVSMSSKTVYSHNQRIVGDDAITPTS